MHWLSRRPHGLALPFADKQFVLNIALVEKLQTDYKYHTYAFGCRYKSRTNAFGCWYEHVAATDMWKGTTITRCAVALELRRFSLVITLHAAGVVWNLESGDSGQEQVGTLRTVCQYGAQEDQSTTTLYGLDGMHVLNVYDYASSSTVPVPTGYRSRKARVAHDSSTTSSWWLASCAARQTRRPRIRTNTSTVCWSVKWTDAMIRYVIYAALDSSTTSFGACLRACIRWLRYTGSVVHDLVRLPRSRQISSVETYLRSLVDSSTISLGGLVRFFYAGKVDPRRSETIRGGACSCSRGNDGTAWECDSSTTSVATSGCVDERAENHHGCFAGCWVSGHVGGVLRAGGIRAPLHCWLETLWVRVRATRKDTFWTTRFLESVSNATTSTHKVLPTSWRDSNTTSPPLRAPLQKPGISVRVSPFETILLYIHGCLTLVYTNGSFHGTAA